MFKKLFFVAFLVTFFNSYSQNLDPLRTDDYYAQEKWVDSILNSMTIDQKMGQLFMIQAYSNLDTVHENKIKEMMGLTPEKKDKKKMVDEKKMTSAQKSKKEDIVKGMKKSLAGFKARYGDKAKSVMYATATKAAKKD